MKPLQFFLTLLLLPMVICDSLAQVRDFDRVPTSGSVSNTKGETFALLIGINKYDSTDINNLNFCVQDR